MFYHIQKMLMEIIVIGTKKNIKKKQRETINMF